MNTVRIDAWYGVDGSARRFDAILVSENIDEDTSIILIDDQNFLELGAYDEPVEFKARKLKEDYFVGYDEIVWSEKGFVKPDDIDENDEIYPR